MVRTIVTIDELDKNWLLKEAKREHVSMAELIRRAVKKYRTDSSHKDEPLSLDDLLQQTRGIWSQGDGLEYQNRVRSEWNDGK